MKIHHYPITNLHQSKWHYMASFALSPQYNKTEIRKWCYNTYGTPGIRVNTNEIRWTDKIFQGEIVFSSEDDLTMFLLKWA